MTEHAADSRWIERSGRLGLATKGLSYLLVAVIALKVALGGGGQTEDRQGTLATLADEPFGWLLLALVALGFGAYALWRFAQALFDRDREGDDPQGLAKRLGDLAKGVFYAALAVMTVLLLAGSGGGSSGEEDRATATVLDFPLGRWLVGLGGLAFVGAGAYNAWRALSGKFEEDLRTEAMDGSERPWYTAVGVAGHLARAVVFALVGIFLAKAALEYDPQEAIGLDGALRKVSAEAYGAFLLGAVALGLAAYGLFCLVQARYRDV